MTAARTVLHRPHIDACLVSVEWDDEAEVWVASSDDVLGLATEHADFRLLQKDVEELVPILLVANNGLSVAQAEQARVTLQVLPDTARAN